MKRAALMLAMLVAGGTAYVGCKQGDGDRCQVNEDCDSDICNQTKGTCERAGSNNMMIDGAVVIDAPADAPLPADAAVDAMVDAP